jgi:hypothetical protein
LTKPDFKKIVVENNELYKMTEDFIPRMIHPKVFAGFAGFQLVSVDYLVDELAAPGRFTVPLTLSPISSIIDIGTMARLAGSDCFEEDAYIIFVRKGLPWATTFFTLLTDIYKIYLAETKNTDYAASKDGLKEAAGLAKDICKEIFPDYIEEILSITNKSFKEVL